MMIPEGSASSEVATGDVWQFGHRSAFDGGMAASKGTLLGVMGQTK